MNELVWGVEPIEIASTTIFNADSNKIYRSHNEIWFNCSVTLHSINYLIKIIYEVLHDEKLSAYREANTLEVILHIDSNGGYVKDCFKFIDFVRQLQKKNIKFTSIINGSAYSCGSLMAIVCNNRKMTKHSNAMIHELSSCVAGEWSRMNNRLKQIGFLHNYIVTIYTEHSKLADSLKIKELLEKETWFTPEQYLELGFIDSII
jgi:ATP-dependent protease ClpP protease subunit